MYVLFLHFSLIPSSRSYYIRPQTNSQPLRQTQAQYPIDVSRSTSSSKNHPKMRPLRYPERNDIPPLSEKVQDIHACCFKQPKKGEFESVPVILFIFG